jgi:transposase-like protein
VNAGGEGTPHAECSHPEQTTSELGLDLDAIVREGARRMLAAALEAEVDAYLAAAGEERDAQGRRLVVRNGHARQRQVTTAAGTVAVRAPRVDDRRVELTTGERVRDLRRRGMRAPVLAVGDGALGLWAALGEVFPTTRHQRDWVHKVANVLGCLPKSVQAGARRALAEIRDASDRDHAEQAIGALVRDYGVKWPRAVAKITEDAEALLCFFDFPAEHWLHLKTSNPVWVFSFPHQLALPEREMAGRWWQRP